MHPAECFQFFGTSSFLWIWRNTLGVHNLAISCIIHIKHVDSIFYFQNLAIFIIFQVTTATWVLSAIHYLLPRIQIHSANSFSGFGLSCYSFPQINMLPLWPTYTWKFQCVSTSLRRSLVGFSPWGREESDTTERLHFHFSLSCIGEGNGNPLRCSCLENSRDSRAWWAAIYGVAQSQTWLKWLSSSSYLLME